MILTSKRNNDNSENIIQKYSVIKNGIDCIELLVKDKYKDKLKQEDKLTTKINKLTNNNNQAKKLINNYKLEYIPKNNLKAEFLKNLKVMLSTATYLSTTKKQYFINLINKLDDLTLEDIEIQNKKVKSIMEVQK